ncbi:MAG: precorrin-2 C(20)-methyltransferase [Actinomycetia bacterium]|nr:precorrin-2 C(20)-methyltransferase [Actinomycetes bacterium]
MTPDERPVPGRLYGVGVGPGDPEWLTLAALRVLVRAPTVAYPAAPGGAEGFAYRIVRTFLDPARQELLPLAFPMTREPAALEAAWDHIADEVARRLSTGRDVAFVTEGDPLLYSTFVPLRERLSRRCPEAPIEVVPGVPSFAAAAARLGWALGRGDERLAVVPATDDREALRAVLEQFDTVVLLKVAKVLDPVLDLLEEMGLLGGAAVLSHVGGPAERVERTVARLKGERLPYMTLMVVRTGRSRAEVGAP